MSTVIEELPKCIHSLSIILRSIKPCWTLKNIRVSWQYRPKATVRVERGAQPAAAWARSLGLNPALPWRRSRTKSSCSTNQPSRQPWGPLRLVMPKMQRTAENNYLKRLKGKIQCPHQKHLTYVATLVNQDPPSQLILLTKWQRLKVLQQRTSWSHRPLFRQ